jgi:hypothetical protein
MKREITSTTAVILMGAFAFPAVVSCQETEAPAVRDEPNFS